MPKLPINYDKTHFYKLCCRDPTITDIYVGHTTDFTRRKMYIKPTVVMKNQKIIIHILINLSEIIKVAIIGTWS